ncbi:divalent-cation tolerance protein CutA [Alkalimonas sp. MEB108]|uniref:Divalent-cation tolerance protein CutA n=1 Tax=Alkalimonas cellulosilytica TaxID=3058395 RepID=A0ABU7J3N4_9GAMM|nr:divalent-cation tolerance protein CutA [Alkalimonas sp. MEB108]MEE2001108.1 divalent-cation tolerance protein CutA [Alkalimonas sp. MEB108]
MAEFCLVMTTCPNQLEADQITAALLQQRLAACIQQQAVSSHYVWQGKLEQSSEILLLIKTTAHCYPALEAEIRKLHSYDTPEIIQLPIEAGFADYLQWVKDSCR